LWRSIALFGFGAVHEHHNRATSRVHETIGLELDMAQGMMLITQDSDFHLLVAGARDHHLELVHDSQGRHTALAMHTPIERFTGVAQDFGYV
jgi:hypothetical protein